MLLCGWFVAPGPGWDWWDGMGWDGMARRDALVGPAQRVRFCAVLEAETATKTFCFAVSFCAPLWPVRMYVTWDEEKKERMGLH